MRKHLQHVVIVACCLVGVLVVLPSVGESQTPGSDTPVGLMFSVMPADAMFAMALDGNQLTELVPMLPEELFIGPESAFWQGIDQTVANHFGIHVASTTLWGIFVGFDDDDVGIIAIGPVTGETTLTPLFTYRDMNVYGYGEDYSGDPEVYFYYTSEGLVAGTLAAVTGVLDTVFGGTQSLLERSDLSNAMTVINADTVFMGIGTIDGLDEVLDLELDDIDLFEETVFAGLAVDETGATWFSTFEDPALANTAGESASAGLEEARGALDDAETAAADEEFGEELAIRVVLNMARDLVDGRFSHRVQDNTVFFEIDGNPVAGLTGIMSLLMLSGVDAYDSHYETEEALMNVRRLFDSSVSYYDADHTTPTGEILVPQFPASVPLTPAEVPCYSEWVNYEDWSHPTWEALNFALGRYDELHHYSYQYDSSGTHIGATFTASAFGDLDCDGVFSTFVRSGEVITGNEIRGFGGVYVVDEFE